MEELKFKSSTFDTIARRRLVKDQDTIVVELIGKIQELHNEITCTRNLFDPWTGFTQLT